MPAYVIVDVDAYDTAGFDAYKIQAAATIFAQGGQVLVATNEVCVLEGDWHPRWVTVLQFEDVEAAKRWWSSQEYEGPRSLRQRTTTSRMIVAEGFRRLV